MDSMLAAEFRTSVFNEFKVDVPFMLLLDKNTTIVSLATTVTEKLSKAREG